MALKNITGWNIRQIRIEKGMTIGELYSALPLSSPLSSEDIAQIELGARKVYDHELLAISQALKVPIASLFLTPHKKVKKTRI